MSPTASPTTSRSSTSNRSKRRSLCRSDACPGASPSCRKGGRCQILGPWKLDTLGASGAAHRAAHSRVPEFLDVIGDAGNDLVLAPIGEELADLVRHIDEAVGRHGAGLCDYSAATRRSAMRRLCRVSSSYSSCHSDGPFEIGRAHV